MEQLEAREADLAEYLLEELTAIHGRMTQLGWRPKDVQRLYRRIETLCLVLVISVRKASLQLWADAPQDDAAGLAADADHPRPQQTPPTAGDADRGAADA